MPRLSEMKLRSSAWDTYSFHLWCIVNPRQFDLLDRHYLRWPISTCGQPSWKMGGMAELSTSNHTDTPLASIVVVSQYNPLTVYVEPFKPFVVLILQGRVTFASILNWTDIPVLTTARALIAVLSLALVTDILVDGISCNLVVKTDWRSEEWLSCVREAWNKLTKAFSEIPSFPGYPLRTT